MSHTHNIIDDDKYFTIDPITRTITNLSGSTTRLMQYDHNSERFTFEMPRYIENHDMSLSDLAEIHYVNSSTGTSASKREMNYGIYKINDMSVDSEDEETVKFTWLISQNATQHAGTLKFQIKFKCYDETSAEVPNYIWNTDMYNSISIVAGLNSTDAIEEAYPDVLKTLADQIAGIISLPAVTEEDNGKIAMVENAEWVAKFIENYEGVDF